MALKLEKINGTLPGMEDRLQKSIDELFTYYNVIAETIHNGLEHGNASAFCHSYFKNDDGTYNLTIFNNGKTMTEEQLKNIISTYICHDITNSTPSINGDFISLTGCALKDVCLYIANPKKQTKVTFINYNEDGTTLEWSWLIDKKNPERGWYYKEPIKGEYNIIKHTKGFEIQFQNCKAFNEAEFENSINRVCKILSNEIIKDKKIIQYQYCNNKKTMLQLFDPLHLEEFPDDIYNCENGYYHSERFIFKITEKTFVNVKNKNDKKKIRLLTEYINPGVKFEKKEGNLDSSAGLYPMKGGKYYETGGNMLKHFGKSITYGHGMQKCRIMPFITDENEDLFGITSIKMNGIAPLIYNTKLQEYICEEDGKTNIYQFFESQVNFCLNFHQNYIESVPIYSGKYEDYKEALMSDLEKFDKNNSSKTERKRVIKHLKSKLDISTFQTAIIDTTPCYCLNKKDQIVRRDFNEIGEWTCSINENALKTDLSLISNEVLLSEIFDTLQEIGMEPAQYQEFASKLTNNINSRTIEEWCKVTR